ncbi:MAG: O-antigen ligase family protein [bacterium]
MLIIDSLIKLFLGLIVLLMPLYFDLRLSDNFGLSKTLILYLFSIVILYLLCLRAIFYKEIPFKKTLINLFLFIFIIINIASSLASTSKLQSIFGEYKSQEGLITLFCYVLLLFIVANFIDREKGIWTRNWKIRLYTSIALSIAFLLFFPPQQTIGLQILESPFGFFCFIAYFSCFFFFLSCVDTTIGFIKILIMGGMLSGIYYDLQLKGWDFIQWERGASAYSTFGNMGWIGHYGMLVFFPSLSLFLLSFNPFPPSKKETKKRKNPSSVKYLSIAISFIIVIFLFISFFQIRQRSTFVGLLGGSLFFLSILGLKRIREYKKVVFVLCLIFIPLFFFYGFTGRGIFIRSIREFGVMKKTDQLFGREGITTIGIRLHIWKACLKIIKDYPILGCGLDTMMTVYPRYRTLKHVEVEGQYSRNQNAHNDLLQITSTTGFLGLFSYLLFHLSLLFAIIRSKLSNEKRILLAGLGGCWMAHHANNLFSFGIPPINATWWVIMGLLISFLNEKKENLKISLSFMKWPIFGITSLIALLGILFIINMYRADCIFKHAKAYDSSKRLIEAIPIYKRAIKLNPYYKDYSDGLLNTYLTLARENSNPEYTKEAVILALKSVKFFPEDSIAWNFLGGAYYLDGVASGIDRRDEAVYAYKNAVKFEPFLRDAYTNIGQIRASQKRYDDSLFWFKKALEFIPDEALSLYYVGYILFEKKRFEEGKPYLKRLILLYPGYEKTTMARKMLEGR